MRNLYADSRHSSKISSVVDDAYIGDLAQAVTGNLGGKVGVAPRIFLKKLVGDILDRVDQFADFEPRQHYALTISDTELNVTERAAKSAHSVDEIELDL